MKTLWANFLHIYQPSDQQADVLEAVVAQSYRPVLDGIKNNKDIRLTLNITGALFELFDKYGYHDLIDTLRQIGQEGRVEFTGSAKYHALLPFLEDKEIIRQIQANNDTNKFYLGEAYKPKGFFPPEMAYKDNLAPIIEQLGFEWVILDEISLGGRTESVDYTKNYRIKGTKLGVFFRERRLSNLVMSAVVRSVESLIEATKKDIVSGRYIVTAMDGETFGHHRPGLEKTLFEIFKASEFKWVTLSDINQSFSEFLDVSPVASTWASSSEDISKNIQFLSWSDPNNEIHKLQWEFLNLVLQQFYTFSESNPDYKLARQKMDIALASDHFWWASAKPWWSLEMIEDGAFRLLEIIHMLSDITPTNIAKAHEYYEKIISKAFQWQRSGRIRQMVKEQRDILRIPFKERTVGKGGQEQGVYYAFIDMMKKLEIQAREKGEYEKAILWRDSIYKLENNLDIYDTINALDLVRMEMPHKELEVIIEKYKDKYREIRGGQPEQRGS